jgi:hypothetical protein
MELKFGLATPSNLWSLDWSERQQSVSAIVDSGFDHIFMADHVSFRDGSGTDGFVEVASLSQLNPECWRDDQHLLAAVASSTTGGSAIG